MAGGLEVADVFRRFGANWRAAQTEHLDRGCRRVMAAIEACRTAQLGGHSEACGECGLVRVAYNSCHNRHCPKCQGLARAQWLADRQAELLPVPSVTPTSEIPDDYRDHHHRLTGHDLRRCPCCGGIMVPLAPILRLPASMATTTAADRHLKANTVTFAVLAPENA